MEEELRRLKEDFKRRVAESNASSRKVSNADSDNDDEFDDDEAADELLVSIAVKAGLFLLGGISMCFSTFFIPGIVPFLGGLLCGVSLIEPPPLPSKRRRPSIAAADNEEEEALRHRNGSDPNGVMKQVLLNFIDHFF